MTEHQLQVQARRGRLDAEKRHYENNRQQVEEELQLVTQSLRPATVADYAAWVKIYLDRGGKFTHYYDYDMPEMWVATGDVAIGNLFGSDALTIIVPDGLKVTAGGHCELFFMDGFTTSKRWVPSYNDLDALIHNYSTCGDH